MQIDSKYYIHDSDRIALQALEAIPGFPQLLKAFMKVWNEKQFQILNMSSNIRISENQLPKYYNMLLPICEKLGIDVPELYLTLDVNANAYTYGDTKPFIVITSGLLETVPEELLPSVLAHECGHIACHHCLYTTMGSILLNGTSAILSNWGLAELATIPIQIAFYYWMRCSEYSADRAALLYDGTSDKIVEMCMRFAGMDKDLREDVNIDLFLEQAVEYKSIIEESMWNKTLEFIVLSNADHPFNAVRAYEANEWAKSERYTRLVEYMNLPKVNSDVSITDHLGETPMTEPSRKFIGMNYEEVQAKLIDLGLKNITLSKITNKGALTKEGQVLNIRVNDKDGFASGEWIAIDATILIEYYGAETEEEINAAHPGQLRTLNSSKYYLGKVYTDVVSDFEKAGFTEIVLNEQVKTKKGFLSKEGSVAQVSINGQTQFEKGEWFSEKATITITYHTFTAK